jgi:hypothetical protein
MISSAAAEKGHRYVDAQRSGGLEVEDKFEFDRLHHWWLASSAVMPLAAHRVYQS